MRNVCRICSAPLEIREAVEFELRKPDASRMTLRQLQTTSRFSRSSLSRHWRNCMVRARLLVDRKRGSKTAYGRRIVVVLPDGSLLSPTAHEHTGYKILTAAEVRENDDAIIGITYRQATIGNPSALTNPPVSHIEREKECQHKMIRINLLGIERCQNCGFETHPSQPIGPSFADIRN